jgi:hypothetical protein
VVAWLRRPQRNQCVGQVEVEIIQRQRLRTRPAGRPDQRSAAILALTMRPGSAAARPFGRLSTASCLRRLRPTPCTGHRGRSRHRSR